MIRRVGIAALCLLAIRCGGSSPSAPSTSTIPASFRSASQQVNFTNNTITFTWTASTGSYRLSIGSASGLSDMLSTTVSDTTYTWTAPRTATVYYARVANASGDTTPAQEIPVFTLDLRDAIDALFFGAGPLSDAPTVNPGDPAATVFPDGVPVTVLVTAAAAPTQLSAIQAFVTDYQSAYGTATPMSVTMTATDYQSVTLDSLPENTIIVRVWGGCPGVSTVACSSTGTNRSVVSVVNASPLASVGTAHEFGHALGLRHIVATSAARTEYAFLMNPTLIAFSARLTQVEKNALAAARAAGLRSGWTRNQALAAGIVRPSGAAASGVAAARAVIASPRDVIR